MMLAKRLNKCDSMFRAMAHANGKPAFDVESGGDDAMSAKNKTSFKGSSFNSNLPKSAIENAKGNNLEQNTEPPWKLDSFNATAPMESMDEDEMLAELEGAAGSFRYASLKRRYTSLRSCYVEPRRRHAKLRLMRDPRDRARQAKINEC
jgi:hypothetical protein